jgi:hypothetical protein
MSLSEAGLNALRERFKAALCTRQPTILDLPRRVRLRLWLTDRINGIAIWLVDHHHFEAAVRLWRVCGMWGEP